ALLDSRESGSLETPPHAAAGVWSPTKTPSADVCFAVLNRRFGSHQDVDVQLRRSGWDFTEDIVRFHNGAAAPATRTKLSPVQKAFRGREAEELETKDIARSLGMLRRLRTAQRRIEDAVKAGHIKPVEGKRGVYQLETGDKTRDIVVVKDDATVATAMSA